MKSVVFLSTIMLITYFGYAQSPQWTIAKSNGGAGSEMVYDITSDAQGNIYATGIFYGSPAYFDTVQLFNAGTPSTFDFFVVKYDSLGNVKWAKRGGGTGSEYGNSIAVDADGNVYVAGAFHSASMTLGTTTLNNFGCSGSNCSDMFVVKYDSTGSVVWALKAGSSGYDEGLGIGVDAHGGVYVTGKSTSNSINFGSVSFYIAGMFLVKYNANGTVKWARMPGGNGGGKGRDIATDSDGNCYVTGSFTAPTITFGSTTLTNTALDEDILVVKYDSSGNVVWANSAGGTGEDEGVSIATDGNGNAFITGVFNSPSLTFGSSTLTSASTTASDLFIAHYDANGNAVWGRSAGGSLDDQAWGIAADAVGNTYVTGTFYSPNLAFGSDTIMNTGIADIFVVSHDISGSLRWTKSPTGSGAECGYTISARGIDECLVGGTFISNPINFGTIALNTTGQWESFIAKLGAPCTLSIPTSIIGDSAPCAGSTQPYMISPVPGALYYSWLLPSGWTGTSLTDSISVVVDTPGGTISVAAVNGCGTGPAQTFFVAVQPLPAAQIMQTGTTLSVPGGFSGYQWFYNGSAISGANSATHTATGSGNYHVELTSSAGCIGMSDTVSFTLSVPSVGHHSSMSILPNPATVSMNVTGIEKGYIHIYDQTGRIVIRQYAHGGQVIVDVSKLPAGVYYLRAEGEAEGLSFVKQ